jgi:hypothetical protein
MRARDKLYGRNYSYSNNQAIAQRSSTRLHPCQLMRSTLSSRGNDRASDKTHLSRKISTQRAERRTIIEHDQIRRRRIWPPFRILCPSPAADLPPRGTSQSKQTSLLRSLGYRRLQPMQDRIPRRTASSLHILFNDVAIIKRSEQIMVYLLLHDK